MHIGVEDIIITTLKDILTMIFDRFSMYNFYLYTKVCIT